jgi:serine acetyltransferase
MSDPQVTIVMVPGKVYVGAGAHNGPNAVVLTNVPAGATVVAPAPRLVQPATPSKGQDEPHADVL